MYRLIQFQPQIRKSLRLFRQEFGNLTAFPLRLSENLCKKIVVMLYKLVIYSKLLILGKLFLRSH